jgi:hypothetical protein
MRTRTLLAFAFILMFSAQTFSQTDQKGVRFGMLVTPQIDWLRSGDTKQYAHDGVNGKFGFGLSLEFRLTDVVHFMTGIGGTFAGGGVNYTVGATPIGYYADNAQNPIKISDLNGELNSKDYHFDPYWDPSNHSSYKLLSRVYKTTYVTIPVTLKMMTKPIGPLKYFGIFGGNLEVLTGAKATDQVLETSSNKAFTLTAIDVKNDCNFFKASLNVGLGAEYTLSGTTALTFGLNYYRAFTSLTNTSSSYLIKGNSNYNSDPNQSLSPAHNSGGFSSLSHSTFGDGIALTVGVLF